MHTSRTPSPTRPGVTPSFASVGACWVGGPRFLLRPAATRAMELVRTTQDGVAGTARPLSGTADADLCSLLWTGQRLVVLTAPRTTGRPTVRVLDADGGPIQGLPPRMLRPAVSDGAPELGFVPDLGQGHELVVVRHGWFHYVHEENLALAAWTDQDRDGATASIARSRGPRRGRSSGWRTHP